MADLTPTSEKALSRGLLDVLIRAGLIAVLVIVCYQIFHPFLDLMLWSRDPGDHALPAARQAQGRCWVTRRAAPRR